MITISQRDPRWGNVKIGNTKTLVKDKGCTITCIAMASDYFGYPYSPEYLAKTLSFTQEAKVIWSSIEKVCHGLIQSVKMGMTELSEWSGTAEHGFKFDWRFYQYEQALIDEALKNPRKVSLLNVQGGAHWVVAIRRVPFTSTYWVADPWTGTRKLMSGVVGGAILIRK